MLYILHPRFVNGFILGFVTGVVATVYSAGTILKRAIRRFDDEVHPIKDILKHPCGAVSRSYVK
jgi:hypothetical protein